MTNIEPTGSPFDAGRIPCPQGGEDRWSTRWLMEKLGYDNWQNFEKVIERAKITAHNQGFNVRTLFTAVSNKGAGRPQNDYLVTRFAAYLIAMNGDPRKPQVAEAQEYFAVRTREAELAITQQLAIPQTYAQALRAAADEADRADRAEAERDLARRQTAELQPSAFAWDRLHELGTDFEVDDAAKILSRDVNINIGRDRLYEYMGSLDWIFRGRRRRWKAYQDQVDLGRLKHRPGDEFWDKETERYRRGDPTILVTPKGLAELHQRLLRGGGQLELVAVS